MADRLGEAIGQSPTAIHANHMTVPAPPLEGFIVVVQHRPDVARKLESALAHAGATVFVAREASETVKLREKFDAQLGVFDNHDAEGEFNESVVIETGSSRTSAQSGTRPNIRSPGLDDVRDVDRYRAACGGRHRRGYEWRRLLEAWSSEEPRLLAITTYGVRI